MFKRLAPTGALVVALAATGTAFAGNGGQAKSSASSISGPIVVGVATPLSSAAAPSPSYGDTITFDVSTTATSSAYVDLKCYQGGVFVGEGWAAFFAGATPGSFKLYSGPWTGGAADCTADLGMFASNGKWKVLASTTFHVDA
jgi:hypothetical protein